MQLVFMIKKFGFMQAAIFETKNLNKIYETDGSQNAVIAGLDLVIHEGQFTVVMGSSGSGKSTLLYLLSGLDQTSGGEIWLRDEPVHRKNERELALLRRQNIGFVFQNAHLVPNLTVLENILVTGFLKKGDRQNIRRRAEDLLRQTGLQDLANRLPSQLSGGEQQRCAIVRALINNPKILLADEPTGSLNSAASQTILDILSRFHKMGQTILMVTHDIKSACRGERILYFRDGGVVDELHFEHEIEPTEKREQKLAAWLVEKGW